MSGKSGKELVLLPSLAAQAGPNGGFVLTRKYIEGVAEFARNWSGPVTSLVRIRDTATGDMDHAEFFANDPETPIELRPDGETALVARLEGAGAVLAFLSPEEAPLIEVCRVAGVPLVFYAEYSPQTERQIVDAETANPLLRFRRKLWIAGATRQRRKMVQATAGLQCSGTPVYDAYRADSADCLLFFDNRIRAADVIDEAGIKDKARALAKGRPLRLVFGGRLIAMKGVMDLPDIAQTLCANGTDFVLDIYGTGPLEADLRSRIEAAGLAGKVHLKGALDFQTGWVPMLKEQADLFLCPHPQGDPSSTYPEVMSCGVPILGYDNAAFRGIVGVSDSGWLMPIGDTRKMAAQIRVLDADRAQLTAAGKRGYLFANAHCFETTFAKRAQHIAALSIPS